MLLSIVLAGTDTLAQKCQKYQYFISHWYPGVFSRLEVTNTLATTIWNLRRPRECLLKWKSLSIVDLLINICCFVTKEKLSQYQK